MAQFIGVVSGKARTEASRLGSKNSGIESHTRGWDSGVRVFGWFDETNQMDRFRVFATGGSNGQTSEIPIAETNPETGKIEPIKD